MSDIKNLRFGVCDVCRRPICQCPKPTTPHALTRGQVERMVDDLHAAGLTCQANDLETHDAAIRQTLAQQAQRIQELEEQRVRYGPICLNCGKDKPCMTEAEANLHGGSIPCTFDPAPKELWQRYKQQAQEVERLKVALEAVLPIAVEWCSPEEAKEVAAIEQAQRALKGA